VSFPLFVYCSWRGRISRTTYWLFGLLPAALYALHVYVLSVVNAWVSVLILATVLVPSIMINIKRSHDRDRSGWFSLLLLVPVISIWPLVELGFLKGTDGPNHFGAPVTW
jgi:uncharacterized membrane protein YhaH (DUF805 family)